MEFDNPEKHQSRSNVHQHILFLVNGFWPKNSGNGNKVYIHWAYYSNNCIFSTFIIRTTKSSQQAVDGFLLPTPRNISSDVTFCLNNISYLKKISKSVNIPHFCKSTQSKKWRDFA